MGLMTWSIKYLSPLKSQYYKVFTKWKVILQSLTSPISVGKGHTQGGHYFVTLTVIPKYDMMIDSIPEDLGREEKMPLKNTHLSTAISQNVSGRLKRDALCTFVHVRYGAVIFAGTPPIPLILLGTHANSSVRSKSTFQFSHSLTLECITDVAMCHWSPCSHYLHVCSS